jgi:TM2 domain
MVTNSAALAADLGCESQLAYRLMAALAVVVLCIGFHLLRLAAGVVRGAMDRSRFVGGTQGHDDGAPPPGLLHASAAGTDDAESPPVDSMGRQKADASSSLTTLNIDDRAVRHRRRSTVRTLALLLAALAASILLPLPVMVALLFPPIFALLLFVVRLGLSSSQPLKPSLGLSLLSLNAAGLAVVFAAVAGGGFVCPDPATQAPVSMIVLSMCLLGVASVVMRLARHRSMMRSMELLGRDRRAPVLYLRSFQDDRVTMVTSAFSRLGAMDYFLGPHRRRFEEVVAAQLHMYGPVVAVSQPGRSGQPIGAAREDLGGETWQHDIEEWLRASRLIVVAVGRTAGVRWELEQIQRLDLTSRLILLFPPVGETELRARWTRMGLGPPEPTEGAMTGVRTTEGATTLFGGRQRDEWRYAAATEAAVLALERSAEERSTPARQSSTMAVDSAADKDQGGTAIPSERSRSGLFLVLRGQVSGPYTSLEVRRMAHSRSVSPQTPVAVEGRWMPLAQLPGVYSSRSRAVALTLAVLVGWLGADRFYLGRPATGLIKGLTLGGFGVWWLMDIAWLLDRRVTDTRGKPLR